MCARFRANECVFRDEYDSSWLYVLYQQQGRLQTTTQRLMWTAHTIGTKSESSPLMTASSWQHALTHTLLFVNLPLTIQP